MFGVKKRGAPSQDRPEITSKSDVFSKFGLKSVKELVGVDIGSTSIKVCLLKGSKSGFTLKSLARKSYDRDLLSDGNIIDSGFVSQELRRIFAENRIKSKDVACALSSYTVITKRVAVPFLEEEALENSISLEVETVIPFPLQDIYYSYYVMGVDEEKEDMMNVQVVAAKKEIVDGYISTFAAAGLNLQILDVDIFCLTNLVEQIYNPQGASVMVIDIGASVTNIAIMKGGSVEFTREILMGGKYLTNQIERAAKLSYEEAEEKKIQDSGEIAYLFEDFIFNISSEINKTINFYVATKPKENIGKIYLTGGSSLAAGLKERISEDTKTEVEHVNPFLLTHDNENRLRIYEDSKDFIDVALYLSTRVGDVGS
jgi:type IV pilus assembly protein PilM